MVLGTFTLECSYSILKYNNRANYYTVPKYVVVNIHQTNQIEYFYFSSYTYIINPNQFDNNNYRNHCLILIPDTLVFNWKYPFENRYGGYHYCLPNRPEHTCSHPDPYLQVHSLYSTCNINISCILKRGLYIIWTQIHCYT